MPKIKNKRNNLITLVFLFIIFILIFTISFSLGKYPIKANELFEVIFGKLFNANKTWDNDIEHVIFKIRMPRILAGALIGAGLSTAGAAFQGLFRNPMVSPDLLGASAGAGFGAALSLFLGLNYIAVTFNSFVFGLFAVYLAYMISRKIRQNHVLGMVLAGIMISSLFTSATSFIKLVADPHNILPSITYWLMGSISSMTGKRLKFAFFPIAFGILVLYLLRWKINLLTMGEDEARSMGVNTKILRIVIITAASLITAACVSISGLIGWIGLVIPHFARLIVGYDYRYMLPASILLGASFLILVDSFARIISTAEIPIGVLTAFVGAPFFLYLILRKGGSL